jgi:hypothetical protein
MLLADISVTSAGWVDFFFLLAVVVAIIGLVICLLGLPIAPIEYRFLWVLFFVWAGFTAAGLLFQ